MKNFRDIDFLSDDNFILWRLSPTPESDLYWSQYMTENPEAEEGITSAINKLSKLCINRRTLDAASSDNLYRRILDSAKQKRRRRSIIRYGAIAASIAVIIGTFLVSGITLPEVEKESIIGQPMPSGEVQLIAGNRIHALENRAWVTLSAEGQAAVSGSGGSGTTFDLIPEETNKLVVPFGKTASIILPDGTKVWLNAGSELEFPSRFEQNNRTVSLIGEMYIEVAPEPTKPFFVRTNEFTIRVTGTKFNVVSFGNTETQSVVLADGSVSVERAGLSETLSPGQMLRWENGISHISEVSVYEYICWKDGLMQFTEASVNDILNRLGRYYNVNFSIGEDSSLKMRSCTGKLILHPDVDEVMKTVCTVSNTTFSREGDLMIITDK